MRQKILPKGFYEAFQISSKINHGTKKLGMTNFHISNTFQDTYFRLQSTCNSEKIDHETKFLESFLNFSESNNT